MCGSYIYNITRPGLIQDIETKAAKVLGIVSANSIDRVEYLVCLDACGFDVHNSGICNVVLLTLPLR